MFVVLLLLVVVAVCLYVSSEKLTESHSNDSIIENLFRKKRMILETDRSVEQKKICQVGRDPQGSSSPAPGSWCPSGAESRYTLSSRGPPGGQPQATCAQPPPGWAPPLISTLPPCSQWSQERNTTAATAGHSDHPPTTG